MIGYRELLEKEIVEAWRTYRFALVAAAFLVAGIVVPVFARYQPDVEAVFAPPEWEVGLAEMGVGDAVDLFARTLIQLGALAAILLAMGTIAGERQRGTLAFVLSKPVTRASVVASKWVALAMQLAVATALAMLGGALYTALLFEPLPVTAWAQMGLVLWLSAMVFASIGLLGSTLAPSPLGAAAIGGLAIVVLGLGATVPTLAPWLPSGLLEVAKALAFEDTSTDLDIGRTVATSISIVAGSLLAAWLAFRRLEA